MEKSLDYIKSVINDGEGIHIEFKEAERNIPRSLFESISSFANTDGGSIFLGVSDKDNLPLEQRIIGVQSAQRLIDDLFTQLASTEKISRNVISNNDIVCHTIEIDGEKKVIIEITVHKTSFKNKPIFIKGNRKFTYVRKGSTDQICDEHILQAMLRDSADDPQSEQIVSTFTLEDLDQQTITSYRNRFNELNTNHAFNRLDDIEFLKRLGAFKVERDQKVPRPTVAGLLMFGKHSSIVDRFPYYKVQYIRKSLDSGNVSFEDRLLYDGSWGEDNLYTFFSRTMEKLAATTRSSSQLSEDGVTRKTAIQMVTAIREALVNSIIHCDYGGTHGVRIIRYPDRIVFSNSGALRISLTEYYEGGHSESRNPSINLMFRMVGLCEEAGSGFPKIIQAVDSFNYRRPDVTNNIDSFELSLWDTSPLEYIEIKNDTERRILEYVLQEKMVTISSVMETLNFARNTATKYLYELVNREILVEGKMGRNKTFALNTHSDHNFIGFDVYSQLFTLLEEARRRRKG